jgi:hypothetical protein
MEDNARLLEVLSNIEWLANVGHAAEDAQIMGSLEHIVEQIERDPDAFFEPPYTDPYEALCVADHKAAAQIESSSHDPRPKAIAKRAYLAAWACLPHPELCGLVSDDAQTIAGLLLKGDPLGSFTSERLRWYEKGRVPWGYLGDYPNGRWLIL